MTDTLKRFIFGRAYVHMEEDRRKMRELAMQRHPSMTGRTKQEGEPMSC